jgi:hypothetical protein
LLDALLLSGLVLGIEGILQDETSKAAGVGVLVGRGELQAQSMQKGGLNGRRGIVVSLC